MKDTQRAYGELRTSIEQLGGSMIHVKECYQWGAWVVTLNGKSKVFESNGNGYPELDRLYVPKKSDPRHYRDYTKTLVNGAVERLIAMLE
ncbi:MAG: hypothetical protein M3N45_10110 [Actinomycetota bacterium]|nr:hypothetical protein [Actinomycetota bacterium]